MVFSKNISADSAGIVGKPAPRFIMMNLNSTSTTSCTLRLAHHFSPDSQHAVIIAFFAEWCGPCRLELPFLQQCADSLAPHGLRLIAVCLDPLYIKKQRQMVRDMKLSCPVVHDKYGALARRLGFNNALPYTVFIDRKGIIKGVSTGYEPSRNGEILEKIQSILGHQPEDPVKATSNADEADNLKPDSVIR